MLMEDLSLRNVIFPKAHSHCANIEQMKNYMTILAELHAQFWNSPRFENDLSWVPNSRYDFV